MRGHIRSRDAALWARRPFNSMLEAQDLKGSVGQERRFHNQSRFDLTDSAPGGSATRSTEL
jgi:hypothetical protein